MGKVALFLIVYEQNLTVILPWELISQDALTGSYRKNEAGFRFIGMGTLGVSVVFSVCDETTSTILKPFPKAW